MNNCIGQRVKTHKGHGHTTGGVHRKQCRDGELAAARLLGLNPNLPCYCVIVCDWEETMKNRTNSVKQFINQMCASTPPTRINVVKDPRDDLKPAKSKLLSRSTLGVHIFLNVLSCSRWRSQLANILWRCNVLTLASQLCAVCRDRIWESGFFLWEIWCWCFSSLKTGFINFFNLMYICTRVRIFSFHVLYSAFHNSRLFVILHFFDFILKRHMTRPQWSCSKFSNYSPICFPSALQTDVCLFVPVCVLIGNTVYRGLSFSTVVCCCAPAQNQ